MSVNKLTIKNCLVNNRENIHLEFKESFHKTQKEYIRAICAFANSKGGYIVYGVADKPRIPLGLKDKTYIRFNDYDSKDLTTQIQACLSVNIYFDFYEFSQHINGEDMIFGVLKIKESLQKPVICKVVDQGKRLREGAIYYRYSGKSEEIKAQDLIQLIQEEKDKEKAILMGHIEKIAKIGIPNAGVFSYDGELFAGDKKIVIDKEIIDKIKFVKEGEFVEKEGAPALILKGQIQNLDSLEIVNVPSDPNITHPFEGLSLATKEIRESKDIKSLLINFNDSKGKKKVDYIHIKSLRKKYSLKYLIQQIKTHLHLDDSSEYCWHNQKNTIKKYNKKFIDKCIEYLIDEDKLLQVFRK